ncbi:hypothetical protein SS50377_27952 [Spironucleus salmonicida]|uniref:Pyridoxamine 5'-phosphate oxidase putative domain-containing protein n=1 Tax=Spironucleus salmonicida TaxID=348837 RepID=V6LDF3_9EUKA|nr:hypothetical protein SS50377_27952 [Spironucleus salmonicida]|eukprot:EST42512.1 Hypothetical protein SS50377_17820 [Spironucleus salmonicida]
MSMKQAMILEFNFYNSRNALISYTAKAGTPELTPIVIFNDDASTLYFNFSTKSRHYAEIASAVHKRITVGNIYTNRRSTFQYELELLDSKAHEDLYDLCWREEVFEMFDEDEFRADRVVFRIVIKSAQFIDEDDQILEEVKF